MPVLKGETSRRTMKGAVVLDMSDLDRQAKELLNQAREEAQRIRIAAKQEAEKLVAGAAEAGRAQGFQQGMNEGREQGRAEARKEVLAELKPRLEQISEAWTTALAQWESDRGEMLLAARQDVLRFALELGKRVTLRAIEADPAVVVDQVAEALSYLSRPTAVTITINPEDRPLLEEALPSLLARFSQCAEAQVQEDASQLRGGCVLCIGSGQIDASIETQLARIVEALLPEGSNA